ncbi:MAG TPA: hypothetical protein VE733_00990 [Streptosporangiaceae bacterium]|nr:hypothetical protein [Streptosporangiaceae bacterium]
MPRSRTFAVLALAFALLGAASGITAASPASAATDTITIVSAGSPAAHVGDLTVVADSTMPITSLTVHLLDYGTTTDVMDPVMTPTPTSTGYESTWTATITEGTPPAGLPLGLYTISVEATDGSTSLSDPNAGTLVFKNEPTITLAPLSATVSYDNPAVTLSGHVTIQAPDGTMTPYANSPVTMASSMQTNAPLSTDAKGDFSITVRPLNGDWAAFDVGPTATVAYGQSPTAKFTLQVDPVQLTASLSAKTVTYGAKEIVSGTVTYKPGTTEKPLTNQTVDVYDSQYPQIPAVTGKTDSNGNYSITLPNTAGTTWTVDAGGSVQNGNPYLGPATVSLPESVNVPTAITNFHATLNQYWQLSFSGCLGLTAPASNTYLTNTSGLTIQYSAGPNGPWQTLSKGYQLGNGCGTHGVSFSGKTTAKLNYAYYRAYYPGTTAAATPTAPKYLSSTSGKVLAWKYADRITAFSVSPTVVPNGGKLTVKGQLQYYYRGWRNFGGQQVLILLRPKGSSTWYWIVKVNTNSTGHFSATVKDPVSATWSAEYAGNSTHLSTGAAMIYVRLQG